MLKHILSLALFFMGTATVMAQSQYVQFTYDGRGNRIGRQITIGPFRKGDELSNKSLDTTAIKEQLGKATVLIYPNPIAGEITVNVQDTSQTTPIEGSMLVMNVVGTQVGTATIKNGTGNFDFHNQPTGTYILRIAYQGKSIDWKVLKQ